MRWRRRSYTVEVPFQRMLATGLFGGPCSLENLLREWIPDDDEAREVCMNPVICVGCGLAHGQKFPEEASVRLRDDGEVRCNDCERHDKAPAKEPSEPSKKPGFACSFCGKSRHAVEFLIAGPKVYICDECIGLCNGILEEEALRKLRWCHACGFSGNLHPRYVGEPCPVCGNEAGLFRLLPGDQVQPAVSQAVQTEQP